MSLFSNLGSDPLAKNTAVGLDAYTGCSVGGGGGDGGLGLVGRGGTACSYACGCVDVYRTFFCESDVEA